MSSPLRRLKVHRESSTRQASPVRSTPQQPQNTVANISTRRYKDCRYCNQDHPLRKCFRFRRLPINERIKVVRKLGYCFNCLAHTHKIRRCTSRERCGICLDEHHTLLHRERTTRKNLRQHSRSGIQHHRNRRRPSHQPRQVDRSTVSTSSNGAPTIVINVAAK